MIDFLPSPQLRALYHEAHQFFAEHTTREADEQVRATGTLHDPDLYRQLAARRWIGAAWPEEAGGLGLSLPEFGTIREAAGYVGSPIDSQIVTELVGAAILEAGTPEQQADFLPRILAGEIVIALGYTEPDSGSDLASVRTTATRVEGGYRIDGAKMFTTLAHVADYVFLLARTDPARPKHRGLSMFLVRLDAPGVEIRPIATFGGERTNATYYDGVVVAESARVGEEHEGWSVLYSALNMERASVGAFLGEARRAFDDLVDALRIQQPDALDSDAVCLRLAHWNARIEAAAALVDRVFCRLAAGEDCAVEAAMTKLAVTDALKDLAYEALDLAGAPALVVGHNASGRLEHRFRHAQVSTIYGGTNEIQRNIIAARGLGLPREGVSQ